MLFVHYLYKESKKNLISEYKNRINDIQTQLNVVDDDENRNRLESKVSDYDRLKAIANVCVFYCMAYYYGFKEEFPSEDANVDFRYENFYSDNAFQQKLIEGFRDLFLLGTVGTIKDLTSGAANLNTWIRDKKSTTAFLEKVKARLQLDMSLKSQYEKFISEFKS